MLLQTPPKFNEKTPREIQRAHALHMIARRLPEVANRVVDELNEGEDLEGCLAEVSAAADRLDRQGFVGQP